MKAIYTNGIFRPVAPVDFPEGFEVEIVIPKRGMNRRFLREEQLLTMDCPFPPEPEWERMLEEENGK